MKCGCLCVAAACRAARCRPAAHHIARFRTNFALLSLLNALGRSDFVGMKDLSEEKSLSEDVNEMRLLAVARAVLWRCAAGDGWAVVVGCRSALHCHGCVPGFTSFGVMYTTAPHSTTHNTAQQHTHTTPHIRTHTHSLGLLIISNDPSPHSPSSTCGPSRPESP